MMHRLLVLLLALTLVGAAPPPARDWRQSVVEDPAGWTFGRPGAPLLAEHASFGCPHCAQFEEATGPRIAALVRQGRIRLAFRPFLIFPHDRPAAVLARCIAPRRRLSFIQALFAAQTEIRARVAAADADDAARGRLYEAELSGPVAHGRVVAEIAGLGAVAQAHGLSAAAQAQCLGEERHQSWVAGADNEGRAAGITGTPTYVWQGKRFGEGLKPAQLLAALPR